MARQPVSKSGNTKVRFMLLEAEGTEADLAQIFSAIQSAVKPSSTVIHQRITGSAPPSALIEQGGSIKGDEDDEVFSEVDADAEQVAPSAPKPYRLRKPTVPKVIDVDLTSGVSLEAFAADHPVKSDLERNLVIAAWFKEHRAEDSLTANHVFTAYKSLGWPFGISDFSGPLRKLKHMQLFESKVKGHYSINHLGVARVQKMNKG